MSNDLLKRLKSVELDDPQAIDAILVECITALSPVLPDEVESQLHMLRKQCIWQRFKGTYLDNGYPYHKHVSDCDICRSADLIERLLRELECCKRSNKAMMEVTDNDKALNDKLQQRIERLEAMLECAVGMKIPRAKEGEK